MDIGDNWRRTSGLPHPYACPAFHQWTLFNELKLGPAWEPWLLEKEPGENEIWTDWHKSEHGNCHSGIQIYRETNLFSLVSRLKHKLCSTNHTTSNQDRLYSSNTFHTTNSEIFMTLNMRLEKPQLMSLVLDFLLSLQAIRIDMVFCSAVTFLPLEFSAIQKMASSLFGRGKLAFFWPCSLLALARKQGDGQPDPPYGYSRPFLGVKMRTIFFAEAEAVDEGH